MQFLRKAPLFLGWLTFYSMAHGIILLLMLPFRGKDYKDQSALIIFVLFLLVLYLLIGFLSFAFSIKNVAVPLHQNNKIAANESRRVKMSAYFPRWLAYLFYLMFFCFPLMCGITAPPLVDGIIRDMWQLVASYFAYRLVVDELIKETVINSQRKDDEKQVITA